MNRDEKRPAPREVIRPRKIVFVGDQDGEAERELKDRLTARFQSDVHVAAAYLARVRYGASPEIRVALCLVAHEELRLRALEAADGEFRRMFRTKESLDVIFLSAEQHSKIDRVARPFYYHPIYLA